MKETQIFIKSPSKRRQQYGAVLVEMAMSAIFLLLMLFGIIQYSITLTTLNTLQQVSREGARYYSVHFTQGAALDATATIAYMQQVATGSFLSSSDITSSTVTIAPVPSSGTLAINSPASITIQYNMAKRSFFGTFVPGVPKGLINKTTVTVVEN